MSCFWRDTGKGLSRIVGRSKEIKLSDGTQILSDGTIHFLLKCAAISKDILLKKSFFNSPRKVSKFPFEIWFQNYGTFFLYST